MTSTETRGRRRPVLLTVVQVVCDVILLGSVVLLCYVMLGSMHGKVAVLFGKSVLRVTTGSMAPSIYEGDYILVEHTPPEFLQVGDIITFYSADSEISGLPNTHRILEIREDGSFLTKGDANPTADETNVTADRVIGRYCGKLRFLKWLGSFASLRKLVLLLVFLTALGVSVYEVRTIRQITSGSDEEKQQKRAEAKEKRMREAIEQEKQRLYAQAKNEEDGE